MNKERQNIIEVATERIANGVRAEKIILFGSTAGKTSDKDSDLDFLIVKSSNQRRDKRDLEIRKMLSDIIYPLDIFVYTPEEVKKYQDLPGSFIGKMIKTGKVLYESK